MCRAPEKHDRIDSARTFSPHMTCDQNIHTAAAATEVSKGERVDEKEGFFFQLP